MSEGPVQATLPLQEGKPWAARRSSPSLQAADTLIFLFFFLLATSSTFLINRKASFPQNPKDFWSSGTIDSILKGGPALLDGKSEDIHGLINLGIACYQKGPDNYIEGLKALERARYLGAMDDRIFWYTARMYEEKGLTHFALEDYERYLRFYPFDTPAQLRVASLFYKEGDTARALKHCLDVLALWPNSTMALYDAASIYNQQGDYAKAKPLLEKCLSEMGGNLPPRGYLMLGQSYEAEGAFPKALTEYLQEFSRNKSDVNVLKALAGTYEKLGQAADAQKMWGLAYQLAPRDPLVRSKYRKVASAPKAKNKNKR